MKGRRPKAVEERGKKMSEKMKKELHKELDVLENELLELDLEGSKNYRYRRRLWDQINDICVQLREAEAS